MLPAERFRQESRTESEIVYADRPLRRVLVAVVLVVWIAMMVYLGHEVLGFLPFQSWAEQALVLWLGGVLCAGLLIFFGFTTFRAWQHVGYAWPRTEIVLDRKNHLITFRYFHLFRAPTIVQLHGDSIAEVVVNRMLPPGKMKAGWWVWLHHYDGASTLVDGGGYKEPIRKLAADLIEALHVPLRELP